MMPKLIGTVHVVLCHSYVMFFRRYGHSQSLSRKAAYLKAVAEIAVQCERR
jgi:hypothetical protein